MQCLRLNFYCSYKNIKRSKSEMKKILMLGTGGTIASEMTKDGLVPELTSEQLLSAVPEISEICDVTCKQLFSLDSTNIRPEHWLLISKEIERSYNEYDGFVISHGTDTMAYTAAALSYLIKGSPKPIVITGAQKPISFDSTDSKINLRDSFICASSDMHGVQIVFNGKVILGTRARKTRSKSFQAFSSINYPYLANIQDGFLLKYIDIPCLDAPKFSCSLNTNVGLLKMIPGVDNETVEFMVNKHDALIIESFGVGGLPSYEGTSFYNIIKKGVERGKIIVITTQVQNEGSDLEVYNVGNLLKKHLNVLEAYDMTTESVVAKLMWILSEAHDFDEVCKRFYTPVAFDILTKR